MPFELRGIGKVGNQSRRGKSPQKYIYRTSDDLAAVTANNYFAPIASMLEVGDEIELQFVQDIEAEYPAITGKGLVRIGAKVPNMIIAATEGDRVLLTAKLDDISTASNVSITSQVAGDIKDIITVLGGTITTANAAISFTIGGVAITNSAITVAAPGGIGDVDTSAPSAANTLAVGDALVAATDGASTGTAPLYIIYSVEPA